MPALQRDRRHYRQGRGNAEYFQWQKRVPALQAKIQALRVFAKSLSTGRPSHEQNVMAAKDAQRAVEDSGRARRSIETCSEVKR